MYYQRIVLILLSFDSKITNEVIKLINKIYELYDFMKELMEENDLEKFKRSDIDNLDYYNFSLRLWLLNNILKDGSDYYNFFFDLEITAFSSLQESSAPMVSVHSYFPHK